MFVLEDTLQGLILFNRIKKPNINSSKVRKVDKRIRKDRIRKFIGKYTDKENCKETQDLIFYWLDLLEAIFGIENDYRERIHPQKDVIVNGHTKNIDIYIQETQVIIEQKSYGLSLDQKYPQSDDAMLTPYEQAKRYNDNLPKDEKASWIVTSNFSEIWIYDMNNRVPDKEENIVKLNLADLESKYNQLEFLLNDKVKEIPKEVELSLEAGGYIGDIYDLLYNEYYDKNSKEAQRSLNILCVRLVFCLYAENADLFNKKQFSDYIRDRQPCDIGEDLKKIFKVLDTPKGIEREKNYFSKNPKLNAFPYVNGGLFEEDIEIPIITEKIKKAILKASEFNWSQVSPTIFGAVFESTLNPEMRHKDGAHFTSIENIHKVIDPLFLDDLTDKANSLLAKNNIKELRKFQKHLASLKFLDPACGSGNFLTETYLCLRRLENRIISLFHSKRQIQLNYDISDYIQVSISQFYGIEINDFAVSVAKTALWIAESQMKAATNEIVNSGENYLPLHSLANIVKGNALCIDWGGVVPKRELSYIMGNPPFIGKKEQTKSQKSELLSVWNNAKGISKLDYVTGWYSKAAEFMKDTNIVTAFVSTNSITQGEQVPILWPILLSQGIRISFAYRTFRWDSEVYAKAQVHCVIIGFSYNHALPAKLYFDTGHIQEAENINPYLVAAPTLFITSRETSLCDAPPSCYGSMPIDNGNLILNKDEKDRILAERPDNQQFIRRYGGGEELIKNIWRWCLWLKDVSPHLLQKSKLVMERIAQNAAYRRSRKRPQTVALANRPALFGEIRQPNVTMLVIPKVSSCSREYIPITFIEPDTIINGSSLIITSANMYHFGVLTSNVHMAWMRTVGGRWKSDYQYSNNIVYKNFPWPNPTQKQKEKIEQTAEAILNIRAKYADCSLANLYDPNLMPYDLKKAHEQNDRAVLSAYGVDTKNYRKMDAEIFEAECVIMLMQMYQELTNTQKKG